MLHGTYTYVLQDADGQIARRTRSRLGSITRPSDRACALRETGRAEYTVATNDEALAAFQLLARTEGILPALESRRHRRSRPPRPTLRPEQIVLVNLSGRGERPGHGHEGIGERHMTYCVLRIQHPTDGGDGWERCGISITQYA